MEVDSNTLEYGPGTIYAGFPSSEGFGVGGQSYSNFPASTVNSHRQSSAVWELLNEITVGDIWLFLFIRGSFMLAVLTIRALLFGST